MYLIDTNIHAAYLLQNFEDDQLTKQYLKFYNKILLADRVVPDFILAEFETFIMQVVPTRYKLEREDKQKLRQLALDYIHRLTNECTIIVPKVETVQRASQIYFENISTHYLSFNDCLVLATAEQNKYTLFTKDERLNTVAKQLGINLFDINAA